jgi:hypothetical protein
MIINFLGFPDAAVDQPASDSDAIMAAAAPRLSAVNPIIMIGDSGLNTGMIRHLESSG